VLKLPNNTYVALTTTGNSPNALRIWYSPNLIKWEEKGYVFPNNEWPSWSESDFWAPEIHLVAGKYLVYFTAREKSKH